MQEQPRWRAMLDILASLATIAAAVAIVFAVVGRESSSSAQQQALGARPTGTQVEAAVVNGLETTMTGSAKLSPSAKAAIIEFSDFECPYCGRYQRDTFPLIRTKWLETGKVNYSFRHFPLESIHKAALRASEASECAGKQGKFWEMHSVLFANQKQLDTASISGFAKELGLHEGEFRKCADGQMTSRVREDQAEAKRFGVSGTPSFLVGVMQSNGKVKILRKLSGAQPYEAFETVIHDVLVAQVTPKTSD